MGTTGSIYSQGDTIHPADVKLGGETVCVESAPPSPWGQMPYKAAKEQVLQQFNESFVSNLLKSTAGNVTQAAKNCGMERQALQQIMRRYGITAEPFRNSKD